MKVKDLMSKKVMTIGSSETLSKALSGMKSAKIHQLVVVDNKKIMGMFELKSVITKDVDPTTAKISNFIKNVPTIEEEEDANRAIEMILKTGIRAIPVANKGELTGIISETDLIKQMREILGKTNMKLKDIMTACVYVDKDEKASKIKNLMFDANISRIPVLDGDSIVGVVGTLDLIKVLEAKSTTGQKLGHPGEKITKEKMKTDDITAESIMSKPLVLSPDMNIRDAISFLEKNEELVIKNGEIGIITPKDVLELAGNSAKKGVYVQITGMHDEGSEFQARMDKVVQEFVSKYGKMTSKLEYIAIHVEKMRKQGPKEKYSIRVRMKAPFGLFVSHAWGWKPLDVIEEAFNKVEREFMRKYEQKKGHDKRKVSKERSRR